MHRHTDEHPTRNEDEYFARQNAELLKDIRSRLDEERAAQERSHFHMKCPKCGADLAEREIDHVKVDVCPRCHGLWLDQGEIDLLRHLQHARGPEHRVFDDLLSVFRRTKPK